MAYPAFHDFVALLSVYNDLLKEAANRNMRDKTMDELYHFFCEKEGFPMCRTGNTLRKRQSALWRRNFFVFTVLTDAMKHISAALQTESMIPEQMLF